MDYIVEKYPDAKVIGVDASQNVIDELRKIKSAEEIRHFFNGR